MIRIEIDTHTHTSASTHAYSTLWENAAWAKKIGLKGICMTNHGPSLPDAPHLWHFNSLYNLPEQIDGIRLVPGIESNVLDADGNLDLPVDRCRKSIQLVLAGIHFPVYQPADTQTHTRTWLSVAKNPYVDIIAHCGAERYAFDFETGVKAFKEYGKVVEINSHSFHVRQGSTKNCYEIARLCKKYEVPVVLSSDAHFCTSVGDVADAVLCAEAAGIPEKQILNASLDAFLDFLQQRQPLQ